MPTPNWNFGLNEKGEQIVLGDEMLNLDSSRLALEGYEAGKSQPSYDKQFVRDWLKSQPDSDYLLPQEVIDKTIAKYKEAYEKLTGKNSNQIFKRMRFCASVFLCPLSPKKKTREIPRSSSQISISVAKHTTALPEICTRTGSPWAISTWTPIWFGGPRLPLDNLEVKGVCCSRVPTNAIMQLVGAQRAIGVARYRILINANGRRERPPVYCVPSPQDGG